MHLDPQTDNLYNNDKLVSNDLLLWKAILT